MPKDWNTVSDNSSSSDQEVQDQQPLLTQQQSQPQTKEEESSTQKQQQQPNKITEEFRQRPKFLSDEELIEKIKNKELDERRKIKIVNCKSEELVETLKNHKLISYLKDIKIGDKPTFYIASFKTEQDLIEFIQEKKTNRYRFFLHPYIKSARDIEREQKLKQRREQDERDKDRYNNRTNERQGSRVQNEGKKVQNDDRRVRDDGKNRARNRPEYEKDSDEEKKRETRKQEEKRQAKRQTDKNQQKNVSQPLLPKPATQKSKQPLQQKPQQPKPTSATQIITPSISQTASGKKPQQQKPQSSSLPEYNFEIQKNTIRIHSNIYSKNRIVDDVVYRKIANKWDRIKIYVKKEGLDKVYELAELIYERINYGLKAIPDQSSKDWIEVVLENKCHVIHPNLEYILLTGNSKKYFQRLQTKNKYLISNEFWIEQYVKEFKNNQKDICKRWKQWLIKAQGDNVPLLLRLYWRLRKELYLNVNIKIGARSELPFALLEIQPQSDKEKRPKPDTSVVNNYLTN